MYEKYQRLIHYLAGMMQDGVHLMHGGQLFDWEDTEIPDLIREIQTHQEQIEKQEIEAGTHLKNIHTGQGAFVINDRNGMVSLILQHNILEYPKAIIWEHFENADAKDRKEQDLSTSKSS